jgi:hypothetical protein
MGRPSTHQSWRREIASGIKGDRTYLSLAVVGLNGVEPDGNPDATGVRTDLLLWPIGGALRAGAFGHGILPFAKLGNKREPMPSR